MLPFFTIYIHLLGTIALFLHLALSDQIVHIQEFSSAYAYWLNLIGHKKS